MQPNSEPDFPQPSSSDAAPPVVSPGLEELLRRIAECSRADKRIILDRTLRHLIGDHPEQESAIYNPDGTSYVFLVPPRLRLQFEHTPEFLAELERSRRSGISGTLSELIARLQTMAPIPESDGSQPSSSDAGPPTPSPELEGLLARITESSRADKRTILDRVVRDMIGDHPDREYGLYNPDGSAYIFLVPRWLRLKFEHTPEFLAELDRRSKSPGKTRPLSEVIAQLESME
jgi:hypothetical protein